MRELHIKGAIHSIHNVHQDSRGIFREWYKESQFRSEDLDFQISQANFSLSNRGVLRGIHYSISPKGQSKLVTCTFGEVLDVIVDLRIGSPTYLKVEKIPLRADSGDVLFIPSGVGHSFLVMSEVASVAYLTSSEFDPDNEKSVCPLDPALGLNWPSIDGTEIALSERDANAPSLEAAIALGILPHYSS